MTKKYAVNEKKPSKMFLNSLPGGGASTIFCNCGRTHYAPSNLADSDDESDYENMLNDALEEQKKDPDGVVIELEDSFIRAHDLGGKTFVDDCPCNGLRKYEDWIWNNRSIIREYLKVRVEQEAKWAEQELILNKLAGITGIPK
jgi:hypothetical protein